MKNSTYLDLDKCILSNDLWPVFINRIGIFKSKLAVRQALDLQKMQGNPSTLPLLILETCGTALVSSEIVKDHIGLTYIEDGMLLIYSNKLHSFQLLRDKFD
tara:strand:+ start:70 stop:375 length:306 start_codon:yes stop_codon:yes gene_type:complete